jgi:DNA-3-methyladenine glycosylase I
MIRRCWGDGDPLMIAYHDTEWGVPLHDDQDLFAKLVIDGFQAGLSWRVILHKRARFLEVFEGFDAERVARYDRRKIAQLLRDSGIIRNRQKVEAALTNARAFLAFRARGDSFDAFLWGFVGGAPRQYRRRALGDLPARSRESDAMSAALVERGFRFVGPTICYAFMQAVGMVNDHLVICFRHGQVARLAGSARR